MMHPEMKKTYRDLFSLTLLLLSYALWAHEPGIVDSTRSSEQAPLKLRHAEPLYIDLIRDLGARKGEREWNLGMGMADHLSYDSYEFLVEYEWAVIDRLGLEIEVPVSVYRPNGTPISLPSNGGDNTMPARRPSDRVESLKLAAQYTFLVSDRWKTSLAVGGITELEMVDIDKWQTDPLFRGILYNPFFIAAKQWGPNWHSLIYTGPRITTHFDQRPADLAYEINSNIHYMIPNSRNFVGVEVNKLLSEDGLDMVIRPQMRVVLSEELMLGIVPGISVGRSQERLSAFARLIYEPKEKH